MLILGPCTRDGITALIVSRNILLLSFFNKMLSESLMLIEPLIQTGATSEGVSFRNRRRQIIATDVSTRQPRSRELFANKWNLSMVQMDAMPMGVRNWFWIVETRNHILFAAKTVSPCRPVQSPTSPWDVGEAYGLLARSMPARWM